MQQTKTAMIFKVALIAAAVSAFAAGAQARELKVSFFSSEAHHLFRNVIKPFAKQVEDGTKGELTLKLFPSSVLGNIKQQLQITEVGVADIAFIVPSYTRGRFPLTEAALLPFAFESAYHGTAVMNSLRDSHLRKEYDTVQLLFVTVSSPAALLTRDTPVPDLKALKGMNIRGAGGAQTAIFKALGANVVSLPISEAYVAMERGTIQGTVLAPASVPGYKLQEVVRFVNPMALSSTPICAVMNRKTWDSLSDAQKQVVGAAADAAWQAAGKSYDGQDAGGLQKMEEQGAKVVRLSAEDLAEVKTLAKPFWDKWTEDVKSNTSDAEAYMADFRKAVDAFRP